MPNYGELRTGELEKPQAQPDGRALPPARTLRTGAYPSRALGREQPFAYLLPERDTGGPWPLLVMLHGLNGRYTDWPTYTRIARYAAKLDLVIAFPDGGNGWYLNAADGSERREDDIVQDFAPYLRANLPVLPPGKNWGIGGLSMGGYGAVTLALKHPHLFSVAASHSGSLEKMRAGESHPVFGDPHRDRGFRMKANPVWLVEQALCRWPTERPRLHIDCGLQDELLDGNRRFVDHLNFIGYPYTYGETPGHHTWPYWDRAFKTLLPTLAEELGIAR